MVDPKSTYHKGRLSVIEPLIEFIDKEIKRQKAKPLIKDEPKSINRAGLVKGLLTVKSRLKGLRDRYEEPMDDTKS